ncbi:MAG: hypothetical protein ACT4OM_04710, partial [Actinomycetota bacterium]
MTWAVRRSMPGIESINFKGSSEREGLLLDPLVYCLSNIRADEVAWLMPSRPPAALVISAEQRDLLASLSKSQ